MFNIGSLPILLSSETATVSVSVENCFKFFLTFSDRGKKKSRDKKFKTITGGKFFPPALYCSCLF
jgi:hypothetical protein